MFATPESALRTIVGPSGHLWGIHVLGGSAMELVGVGGLWAPDSAHPGAAAFILNPSHRGRGVGTLVHAGLLSYAFNILKKDAVRAETLAVNEPSKRSLEKAGYIQKPSDCPAPVPYGTEGNTAPNTQWMAFRPSGPDYLDQQFDGLGAANIAASRRKVSEVQNSIKIEVQALSQ